VIIAGQDQSMGFKVVHDVLGVISIAFGLGAGWLGYRRLRRPESVPERERAPEDLPV
jgi:hypothetical protein